MAKIQLGYANHPRKEILSEIEWIARSGFDFIDLFLEPDEGAIEVIDTGKIREKLKSTGMHATGHLAWYLPIGSPLSQIRRAAVQTAKEYAEAYAEIGVSLMTIHSHWPPHLFTAEEGMNWQIESLQEIMEFTIPIGVKVMYEPVDGGYDSPENIRLILDRLPNLLFHLDIGHANLHGRKPDRMIRQFTDRLVHLHLHDNNGYADLHLPPGTGNINWSAVTKAIKEIDYQRTITIEVFSRDLDYILLAQRKVRGWLDLDK